MRILIYKRTHNGDPDQDGCFGVHDCMGMVRAREFDAVIGVGGIGREAQANRISGKVNWIGIGAHKIPARKKRAPMIMFDQFLDFGTDGPSFSTLAPSLAKRMYSRNVRHVMDSLSRREFAEVLKILKLAESAAASIKSRNVGQRGSGPDCKSPHRVPNKKRC